MANINIHVLFRFSKKTGSIDTTMTGYGSALMQMWALNNTPKTKSCLIFDRESGDLVFATSGTEDGFPKVKKGAECKGTCEDYGIPFDVLQSIRDEREEVEV